MAIPDRESNGGDEALPTLRAARESFRWLIKSGGVLVSERGLHIKRDPVRSPSQLTVDEVLDRLKVVGVSDHSVQIALMKRGNAAYFEIQVDNEGLRHLIEIYPVLSELQDAVCGAATS